MGEVKRLRRVQEEKDLDKEEIGKKESREMRPANHLGQGILLIYLKLFISSSPKGIRAVQKNTMKY